MGMRERACTISLLGLGILNIILTIKFTIHPILNSQSELINAFTIFGLLCVVAFSKRLWTGFRYTLLFGAAAYDLVHIAVQNYWIDRQVNLPEYEAILGSEGLNIGSTPWFVYTVVFWAVAILLSIPLIGQKRFSGEEN